VCVCGCVLVVVSVCVSLLWRVVFFVLQVFGSILDCAGFFSDPFSVLADASFYRARVC